MTMTLRGLITAKAAAAATTKVTEAWGSIRYSSTIARPSKVLVIGAGVIGLRTAIEFVRRDIPVVVRAPNHPIHHDSCSAGAGGFWMPFRCDDSRVDRWSLETLDELWNIYQNNNNDNMNNDNDNDNLHNKTNTTQLVEMIMAISLFRDNGGPNMEAIASNDYFRSNHFPSWTKDERLQFQHLSVEMLSWQNHQYRLKIPPTKELVAAGYKYAWMFKAPVCNTHAVMTNYLHQLTSDYGMDVNVETNLLYQSLSHMQQTAQELGCDAIINCTGMGAKQIMNDNELIAGRGALIQFDRNTCIRRKPIIQGDDDDDDDETNATTLSNINDAIITTTIEPWGTDTYPAYLIPRGDKIIVGGTVIQGDYETTVRDEERLQLLQNAERLGIDIQQSKPINEWVGLRPLRSLVRCEVDDTLSEKDTSATQGHIPIFHNYGHGGSGWTVHVGAARECVRHFLGHE